MVTTASVQYDIWLTVKRLMLWNSPDKCNIRQLFADYIFQKLLVIFNMLCVFDEHSNLIEVFDCHFLELHKMLRNIIKVNLHPWLIVCYTLMNTWCCFWRAAQVRDDTNDTRWVLAGYQDNSLHKPLDLVAMGCNDLDELTEKLEDDRVMYGLYRTADVIDDIKTVKFVYIYW